MEGLFALSNSFDVLSKKGRDDDFVDRINHWYTSIILVILSIFISAKQYFDDAITCWIPNEFSDAWKQYAENYCWIQNTYFVPHDVEFPKPHSYRNETQLSYYQWVPYVLALQTFMFYFPRFIWRLMNWQSGINVQDIVTKAMDVCSKIDSAPIPEEKKENPDMTVNEAVSKILDAFEKSKQNDDEVKDDEKNFKETFDKNDEKNEKKEGKKDHDKIDQKETEKEPNVPDSIKDIAHHLKIAIDSASENRKGFFRSFCALLTCSFGSRRYGSYLTALYIFTKVLYIINVIGQLFLLNKFIGTTYSFFGFQILNDLAKGNDWKNTGHFPRITLCDFEIRNLGNRINYTVQCVLPINLFNEKIYIFIWFWIFIVAILTVYSLFQWIIRMFTAQRMRFICGLLKKRLNNWTVNDEQSVEEFVEKRLKNDGIFLIYLVYLNAGDLVTKELLEFLWFKDKLQFGNKVDQDSDKMDHNDDFIPTETTQFI